jgi:hypothetical protein
MVVASAALFMSLGGVGYAATQLPDNSVGSSQIQNHAVNGNKIDFLAVGFRKIQLGAIGIKRINPNQVQARVLGTCAANSAMSSIDSQGNAQCTATGPKELSASAGATAVTTNTPISSLTLPSGSSYLVTANPQINVSGTAAASQVNVACTLSLNPGDSSTTQTRSVSFQAGTHDPQTAVVPLSVPAPSAANGSAAQLACSQTSTAGTPTATVATSINAIQTASNG